MSGLVEKRSFYMMSSVIYTEGSRSVYNQLTWNEKRLRTILKSACGTNSQYKVLARKVEL